MVQGGAHAVCSKASTPEGIMIICLYILFIGMYSTVHIMYTVIVRPDRYHQIRLGLYICDLYINYQCVGIQQLL